MSTKITLEHLYNKSYSSSSSCFSSSSACNFPATQTDLRPSTGSATVSTKAAAAQALLVQHLGYPIKPPQIVASPLAQPEIYSVYSIFLLLVLFLVFFLIMFHIYSENMSVL